MDSVKNQFPIYRKYSELAYLDSGATALKPEVVIEAENRYYREFSANIHRGVYGISEEATKEYEEARKTVAGFIGAKTEEIIFTKGTTQSLNMVAYGLKLKPGEILVSQMEHHANLLPWQRVAKEKGMDLKYVPMTSGWEIDLEKLVAMVSEKARVLAITHASNVLGTINPIKEITNLVKKKNPQIIVVVDGAQMVAHEKVQVEELGGDFYAFSGHKMYGPTGIGVLWGRKDLLNNLEPWELGGGMIESVGWHDVVYARLPEKLEAGTPPIAQAIGLAQACRFLQKTGFEEIQKREKEVLQYAWKKLAEVEGLDVWGEKDLNKRSGVVAFTIRGIHAHDLATILDRFGVCVRSGHHCTMPLHELMKIEASVRLSLGMYNTNEDIDKLIEGLKEAKRIFQNDR